MENESIPTSYEIPNTEGLSPDDAAAALARIHGDAAANKLHPYCNRAHPQSVEFKAAVTRLHEIKCPEPEAQVDESGAELSNPIPHATFQEMGEALEGRAKMTEEQQEKLRGDAEAELDILESEFDYQRPDVGDDLDAAHLRTFKMFRLAEQNDAVELPIMLEKELKSLGADASALKLFQQYRDAKDLNPELRRDVALLACRYVQQGHKNRRAARAEKQEQD